MNLYDNTWVWFLVLACVELVFWLTLFVVAMKKFPKGNKSTP